MKISSIDLAYIAGFFDGEGCITGINESRKGGPLVRITIGQKKPKILYWIKETLDMGRVQISSNGHRDWRIHNKKGVEKFIDLILPYCKIKREQLIVGRELSSLIGEPRCHISKDNSRKRLILSGQLKTLKKEEYHEEHELQ